MVRTSVTRGFFLTTSPTCLPASPWQCGGRKGGGLVGNRMTRRDTYTEVGGKGWETKSQ